MFFFIALLIIVYVIFNCICTYELLSLSAQLKPQNVEVHFQINCSSFNIDDLLKPLCVGF